MCGQALEALSKLKPVCTSVFYEPSSVGVRSVMIPSKQLSLLLGQAQTIATQTYATLSTEGDILDSDVTELDEYLDTLRAV